LAGNPDYRRREKFRYENNRLSDQRAWAYCFTK
jgi:hypothetical protein